MVMTEGQSDLTQSYRKLSGSGRVRGILRHNPLQGKEREVLEAEIVRLEESYRVAREAEVAATRRYRETAVTDPMVDSHFTDSREASVRAGEASDALVRARSRLAGIENPEGLPDTPFRKTDDIFRLVSARALWEAVDRNVDRIAISDAENRSKLAHLPMTSTKEGNEGKPGAAILTYGSKESGPGAIPRGVQSLLKSLGMNAKAEHIELDGYGHWSFKLSPEVKEKIKRQGFPLLSALAATSIAAEDAEAQDGRGSADSPVRDIAIAASMIGLGAIVVKRTKMMKAEGAFDYFKFKRPKTGKILDVKDTGIYVGGEKLRKGQEYLRIPRSKVYNLTKDPDGIVAKMKRVGMTTPAQIEDAMRRSGFLAYRVSGDAEAVKVLGSDTKIDTPLSNMSKRDALPFAALARGADEKTRVAIDYFASKGVTLHANPIGAAIALAKRAPTAASIGVLGVVASQQDNENVSRMTTPLIGLAVLNAIGSKALSKAGSDVAARIVDQLRKSEAGFDAVHFVNPALLLPEEMRVASRERERSITRGKALGARAGKEARELGPVGDREVSDVIEGEDWESLNGPTVGGVMSVALAHEQQYADLTAEKLRSGVLDPKHVNQRYGGKRLYAEYEALDVWGNTRPAKSVPGGSSRIAPSKQRTLDIPVREAEQALSDAHVSGDPAAIKAAEDALDEAHAQNLGARLDRGEIRESSYRIETTLAEGYLQVANADFLHVATQTPGMVHPEFKQYFDDFDTARGLMKTTTSQADYDAAKQLYDAAKYEMDKISRRYQVKVADASGKQWVTLPDSPGLGALRGMVVDKALHTELAGAKDLGSGNVMGKLLGVWKQSHTIFNPGTNIANVLANIPLAHLAGLSIFEQFLPPWNYLAKAAADLRSDGPATRKLIEEGILDLNFTNATGEGTSIFEGRESALRDLVKTTRPETADVLRRRSEGLVDRPDTKGEKIQKVLDKPRKLYNTEDNVFRAALYLKRIEKGDTPDEAAALARSEFGDFRTRSPLVRMLRGGVSPFILWPLKVMPPVAKNIIDHPYRYLTLAAMGAALNEYSKSQVGEIPEEEIAPRDRRKWGYFFPGFTQLPFGDDKGGKAAIDMSRWTPMSNATDLANPGSTGEAIGERFPRILTPSGPAEELWNIGSTNYDKFRRRPKYNEASGALGVAGEIGKDLARMAAPPAVGFHLPRVIDDLRNNDPDKAKQDALGFTGARPRYRRPGDTAFEAGMALRQDMQRISEDERRELRASKSESRNKEIRADATEKRERAQRLHDRRMNPKL